MKKVGDIALNQSKQSNISQNIREKLLKNNEIINFITINKITEDIFEKNIDVFYEYYVLQEKIKTDYFIPELKINGDYIYVNYSETETYKKLVEENRWSNRIKTEYISKSVLYSQFSKLTVNNEKTAVAKELIDICNSYLSGEKTKGLYIYGKTGIGKSYLMGCVYNYLTKKGKEPAIIYLPEFIRKMKTKIMNGEYNYVIDELREQEVLIIDDIGAENITEFVRDEILVPIISHRSAENLLTLFTSNLSMKALSEVLSNTKNTVDETKAMRILDRIRYLTIERYFDSQNEREFL